MASPVIPARLLRLAEALVFASPRPATWGLLTPFLPADLSADDVFVALAAQFWPLSRARRRTVSGATSRSTSSGREPRTSAANRAGETFDAVAHPHNQLLNSSSGNRLGRTGHNVGRRGPVSGSSGIAAIIA
jgi:hypothetical protein